MRYKKRIRERILLIAATAVACIALALTYQSRTRNFNDIEQRLANGTVINLSDLKSPESLSDKIDVLPTRPENQFIASKIYQAIAGPEAYLDGPQGRSCLQPKSVSDLMQIKVRESDLRKTKGLEGFKRRLEEREHVGLLTPQHLARLRPLFIVRTPSSFRSSFILHVALVVLGFYLCHLLWSIRRFQGDELLLPIMLVLSSIGMSMMISLFDPLRDSPRFVEFAQGVLIGCAAMYAATHMDYRRLRLRAYGFLFLLVLMALAGLLVAFGSGPGQSDAKVNLFGFQPIEIIKILLALYLASYFTRRWELLREMKSRRIMGFPVPRRSEALPVVVALALVVTFLFLQKDLGPAMLFYLLFLVLYGVARHSAVESVLGLALLFLLFITIYELPLARFLTGAARRVAMWISPWDNTVPGGIQLAHSFWALATGGLSGVGLGLGDANMIPAGYTDLILSVLAEQAGFIGLGSVLILYYMLFIRGLRIAVSAKSPYPFFLSLGLTCLLALQVLIIAGGIFALLPLTGVTSPFLSYGKSSTITSFFLIGLLLMISAVESARDEGPVEERLRPSLRPVFLLISVCFMVVLSKVGYVQVFRSDEYLIAGILSPDADRARRFHYNPRLERVAASLPRGSIYDRNGVPIASSHWDEIQRFRETYTELGFPVEKYCSPRDSRHYPLNFAFAHITGNTRAHWNPPIAVEFEYDGPLKGYDDRARVVMAMDLDGQEQATIRRDYRELVPLLRHRYQPGHKAVREFYQRDRNLHLSIDARLQVAALGILKRGIQQAGKERGALVLLASDTGNALALVSYPTFDPRSLPALLQNRKSAGEDDPTELLDRARRGVYPPGSTFKVVTASAALRKDPSLQNKSFWCERLDDGRVGIKLPVYGIIRDDPLDRQPHGLITMTNGLVHSCNAYFAQLGVAAGAQALYDTAAGLFQIYNLPQGKRLKQELAQASFGQGSVLVTPFQMARIAATFANQGRMPYGRWVTDKVDHRGVSFTDVLAKEHAQTIAHMMRGVVQRGTGRKAFSGFSYPVAGKTGTAEVEGKPAHSWFIGFAPWGADRQPEVSGQTIAFSVLIENGGYGGRAAAPVARALIEAWLSLQNSQ